MQKITKTLTSTAYSPFQREVLEDFFIELGEQEYPTRIKKRRIVEVSEETGLTAEQIRLWIRNRKIRGTYKGRIILAVEQVRVLEWVFVNHSKYPSTCLKRKLAEELNLPELQVQKWYKTRRQRGIPALLQRVEYNEDSDEWNLTIEKLRQLIHDGRDCTTSANVFQLQPLQPAAAHQQQHNFLKRSYVPNDDPFFSVQQPREAKRFKFDEVASSLSQQVHHHHGSIISTSSSKPSFPPTLNSSSLDSLSNEERGDQCSSSSRSDSLKNLKFFPSSFPQFQLTPFVPSFQSSSLPTTTENLTNNPFSSSSSLTSPPPPPSPFPISSGGSMGLTSPTKQQNILPPVSALLQPQQQQPIEFRKISSQQDTWGEVEY